MNLLYVLKTFLWVCHLKEYISRNKPPVVMLLVITKCKCSHALTNSIPKLTRLVSNPKWPFSGNRKTLKTWASYVKMIKVIPNVSGAQTGFSTTQQLCSSSSDRKEQTCFISKHIFENKRIFPHKMWVVRIIKRLKVKRQEKCRYSVSSPCWRSVEDPNCILLEACGCTCNRSKSSWDMKMCYFSVAFCTIYAHRATAKMTRFFLKVQYEQQRLSMSHARRLSLSYQQIPWWHPIRNLAHALKSQICSFQNGIGDLTHNFCFHTSRMDFHLGNNASLTKKYKTYTDFDRTSRQSAQ